MPVREQTALAQDCTIHKLIADLAVFAGDRVLLVKYRDVSRYDGQGGWFLPDDYLRYAEHPEDAAKRIALEQTGLEVRSIRLNHIESFGNGAWHLMFHYRGDLPGAIRVAPTGNVAEAEWFPRRKLPHPKEVAHHGWALDLLRKMGGQDSA